jgi:hypothetical protein
MALGATADNSLMGRLWLLFVPAMLLASGCGPAPVSVLKPESQKLHTGMQFEDVERICGKPSMNITDPLGGAAMWEYKDEKVGDHMTVMFNMDGVAKVTYGSS